MSRALFSTVARGSAESMAAPSAPFHYWVGVSAAHISPHCVNLFSNKPPWSWIGGQTTVWLTWCNLRQQLAHGLPDSAASSTELTGGTQTASTHPLSPPPQSTSYHLSCLFHYFCVSVLSPEIESFNLAPGPFVSPRLNHLQIMAIIRSMQIGIIGDRLCLITWKGKFLQKWERRCIRRPWEERLCSRMMCICIYGNGELINLLSSGDIYIFLLFAYTFFFVSRMGKALMKLFRYN